ncbi:ParB/RepB/Spo0J family partition protein [Paraburkholderia flagellata]|uniref:ParB/RepB/Spo0J family partition protein n=1 Tax=Paraburkholderia flagellata TaxID=2883241 RepID=UPI001F2166BA|nr:ParB/RepB/Spo0J family partition protein [Paraburkholderia flagellata]
MNAKMPFGNLGVMLKGGLGRTSLEELTKRAREQTLPLDQIHIPAQERTEFEDEDNSLLELGESLKRWQLQAIVVRPLQGATPYELVAGERRCRAARLVGLTELRAYVIELTDEEAKDARLAENIQRKNLTLIEEARALQADVERLGVQATLVRRHKSHAWLSKRLALLNLPQQTQRLVAEHISADIEVINRVRQIEKHDPKAAESLVNNLEATRGEQRARTQVDAVLETVKPRKARTAPAAELKAAPQNAAAKPASPVAQPAEGHGVQVFSVQLLDELYGALGAEGQTAADVLEKMTPEVRKATAQWLEDHAARAREADDMGRAVLAGLRAGTFAPTGAGAFALAAFLHGGQTGQGCELAQILRCVQ